MSLKRKIMINDKRKDDNNRNNNNRQHFIAVAAATIFTLAIIMAASSMVTTTAPAAATTTTPTKIGNNTASSSSGIQLSAQPIYQERTVEKGFTPINDTHAMLTYSGNGTLTLPNTTQTINTTSNGTIIISIPTSSGYAKETIMTDDGQSATATVYEIVQFNSSATGGAPKGIVTAVFQTNSTGSLAPLNGMIAAGIDDMSSIDVITFWRWESGISSSSGVTAAPPSTNTTQSTPSTNSSSNTNTTTTTTNEASQPPPSSSPLTSLY